MYIADLHIHSHYSRATSKDCTPHALDLWAGKKGIHLLGTGDFTHPVWRKELRETLTPAEDGLYALREDCRSPETSGKSEPVRFVISGEISSIYKKNGKVRKVHSLILLPDLDAAERLSVRLEEIGNIHSDGRPILGLDCRDLLEITLETCPEAIYVPAHIWTPHFSLFGAFSGFDTIEECYGDLSGYIKAVETGLSSDPPMNWRLSSLDGIQLISNSDAHSPSKLGREANLLNCGLSYGELRKAILEGEGLEGTIEFFPEEGKYHYDGHRKCHLCLSPEEADGYGGICPICGRKITIGVQHRVEQLADRKEGFMPSAVKPFESLVPLTEVIAACTGRSAASAKVQAQYEQMIGSLGNEFCILREIPLEEIRHSAGNLIAEGIGRLREGKVERTPGFDGEYGKISLLKPAEMNMPEGQMRLFDEDEMYEKAEKKALPVQKQHDAGEPDKPDGKNRTKTKNIMENLVENESKARTAMERNPEQEEAVRSDAAVTAVIAGPGAGKTFTLVERIRYLIDERQVPPETITAVTFTKKAAAEIQERLTGNGLPSAASKTGKLRHKAGRPQIGTFHSICYKLLKEQGIIFELADELETEELAKVALQSLDIKMSADSFLKELSRRKAGMRDENDSEAESGTRNSKEDVTKASAVYDNLMKERHLLDLDDLLTRTLALLEEDSLSGKWKEKFNYLLVDEFQDINPVQYELLLVWKKLGKELFVIGDPDQAIYGFRGAVAECFERLEADFPAPKFIRLKRNYRSTPQILSGSLSVISQNKGGERRMNACRQDGMPIRVIQASSEMSEAIFVSRQINSLIGGIDMLDTDENIHPEDRKDRSFADIAILYRTHRQAELLEQCLGQEGIPYIVAGREEYLNDREVRGALLFFRHLLFPEEETAFRLCLKLLYNVEQEVSPEYEMKVLELESLEKEYRPSLKKAKPQKLLERWMKEWKQEGSTSMNRLCELAVLHKTMEELLEYLDFGSEGDIRRNSCRMYTADAVTLMTLHGSKGLEFPVVFLYGVKKGQIPYERRKESTDIAEERRLFYVGMTRAREELILTASGEESEFLEAIPENVIKRERASVPKKEESRQMSLYDFIEKLQ